MGKFTMSSGKTFEPLPEDKYQVEIYAVESFVGTKFNSTEEEERLKFTFVILDKDKTVAEEGVEVPVRGRRLWSRTSMFFSPPGSKKPTNLTKLVSAVVGHELDEAEVDGFDEQSLVGKQLCVLIDAKAGPDGTVWNNILSYSKAVKALEKYDDSEVAEREKAKGNPSVKKSQPAVDTAAEAAKFEAEMEAKAKE